MSTYGVTDTGFVIKRLPVIKAELEAAYQAQFGADIDISAQSIFGQMIGIQASQLADIWEEAQLVYNSAYPDSASGLSLDNAVELSEITRLPATSSTITAAVTGNPGTVIPVGFQAGVSSSSEVFATTENKTISNAGQFDQFFQVTGTYYPSMNIEATGGLTVTGTGSTLEQVTQYIVDQVNADNPLGVHATNLGGGIFRLQAAGLVAFSTNTWDSITPLFAISLTALNQGAVTAPVGTLINIITPVSGVTAINNYVAESIGRDVETDTELRARRRVSIQKPGSSNIDSIQARILNDVSGVTFCSVHENDTDSTDLFGNPPHSIHVVVAGPYSHTELAQMIWDTRAGGIAMVGATTGTIIDAAGTSHTVKWDGEVSVPIYVRATLVLDTQSVFPSDGVQRIKNNLVADISVLTIGETVYVQKYLASIYRVPGVGLVTLTMSDDNVTFIDTDLLMEYNQRVTISEANITVTI